ncbi:hypothetical protein R6Z07F_017620 [Ovis aries]
MPEPPHRMPKEGAGPALFGEFQDGRASAGDDGAGSVPLSLDRRRSHVSSGVVVPASHGGPAARTRTEGYDMVRCDGESRRDRPASQSAGPAGSRDIAVPLAS